MRRHKVQTQWYRLLKEDERSIEAGITKRLFRNTWVFRSCFGCHDYPDRCWNTRSWKKYRKTQYRAK